MGTAGRDKPSPSSLTCCGTSRDVGVVELDEGADAAALLFGIDVGRAELDRVGRALVGSRELGLRLGTGPGLGHPLLRLPILDLLDDDDADDDDHDGSD